MAKVCSYDNFFLTSHHIILPTDTWHRNEQRQTRIFEFTLSSDKFVTGDGRHFSCRDELTNFRNSAVIRRTGKTRLAAFSSTRNAFMAARSSNKLEERGRSTQLFSTFFSTGPPHATGPSSPYVLLASTFFSSTSTFPRNDREPHEKRGPLSNAAITPIVMGCRMITSRLSDRRVVHPASNDRKWPITSRPGHHFCTLVVKYRSYKEFQLLESISPSSYLYISLSLLLLLLFSFRKKFWKYIHPSGYDK